MSDDTGKVVEDAAAAILRGDDLDLNMLHRGAAWALRHSKEVQDDEKSNLTMKLTILIVAGEFAEAAKLLMQLALSGPAASPTSSTDDLLSPAYGEAPDFSKPASSSGASAAPTATASSKAVPAPPKAAPTPATIPTPKNR